MIERVIENWLTSVNERQYQIPFCQVLESEGESLIHISTHGPFELGKDIITIGPGKVPRVYQLKGGNVGMGEWRQFKTELDQLVEYEIDNPEIRTKKKHIPFFVTNGNVNDVVKNAIRVANKGWTRHGCQPLRLISGTQLRSRFLQAHGRFLPRDPLHFKHFLELYISDGRAPLDKAKLSDFLEKLLPFEDKKTTAREVQRAAASAVLFTAYCLKSGEQEANHWAQFEGWTVCASYIVALGLKCEAEENWWKPSFDLCILGAKSALASLTAECKANTTKFVAGNPLVDGHFYSTRLLILCGLLAAYDLHLYVSREERSETTFVWEFVENNITKAKMTGEWGVPFYAVSALLLHVHGNLKLATHLAASTVHSLASVNSIDAPNPGFPSPYYGPEQCMRLLMKLDREVREENFVGHSYGLEAMIQFLARRDLRVNIRQLWPQITSVDYISFHANPLWKFFLWKSKDGSLDTRKPGRPQSWAGLVRDAESPAEKKHVPDFLCKHPEFAIFVILTFPHRFTTDTLKVIEAGIANAAMNTRSRKGISKLIEKVKELRDSS